MHPEWRQLLNQSGARIENDVVADYGDPTAELHHVEGGCVLCDLSHFGLIAVHGADAAAFLQGQFCNDVRNIDAARSQLSAHCSPKGRMLASFRLFRHGEAYLLRLPLALRDPLIMRLRMYVLRAKVVVAAADERWTGIGLAGPDAEHRLRAVVGTVPGETDAVTTAKQMSIVRAPGPTPRFEIYGDIDHLQALWTALVDGGAHPAGAGAWALLDIRSGIATVYPETVEAFVPQMTNLQNVGGVSFTKGCYPGQEIVARMQYLGKLKRRMYRVRITADQAPRRGDALFSDHPEAGQDAGMIVDAQPSPDGGYEALAVIHIAAADGGPVRLGGATGPLLELLDLPYTVGETTQQQA